LVRVTPDVLADHLLYRASVNNYGKPTGFIDEAFAHFGMDYLGNLLSNASELDWRATVTNSHEPVLGEIWNAIQKKLPGLSFSQRNGVLSQLNPDAVLRIVEWVS
jgi:hypothetical protein